MFRVKRRFVFIGALVVVVIVVGFLVYMFVGGGGATFITVSELRAQGDTPPDQHVGVQGRVVPGSVMWDGQMLQLTLTDGNQSVSVRYSDKAPENLLDKTLMVVGEYKDGVIEAKNIGNSKTALCSACHS